MMLWRETQYEVPPVCMLPHCCLAHSLDLRDLFFFCVSLLTRPLMYTLVSLEYTPPVAVTRQPVTCT